MCLTFLSQIIGQMASLEIAEMCARSGANCGSLFLDLRFRELVKVCFLYEILKFVIYFLSKTLLQDHPAHLDPPSLAYFSQYAINVLHSIYNMSTVHSFSETDKHNYRGVMDDG